MYKTAMLVKIEKLFGGYARQLVIKNVSFEMEEGSFLAVIGPNGCGKSTLLKLMSRVILPQSGRVLFNGQDIQKISLKKLCRSIAFVSQHTTINFPFCAREIVLMGRIPHLRRLALEDSRDFAIAEEALKLTGSWHLKDKRIDELSAGEQQRVIISKALAQQPRLLFLDEPTSYLDISHQIQILDLLKKLNKEKKLTIIVVLHDLNLASEYCDRIILLNEGAIYKQGAPWEVLTYQNIEAVYKTVVVVKNNPLSNKPYVLLVPGGQ